MKRRKAKRFSEDMIREMLEMYTMRPPFRVRKKKKEPDKDESEKINPRKDKNRY